MPLDTVRLGQTVEVSASFTTDAGTPFVATSPASYVIKDFNNRLVISGVAAQDQTFPDLWSASVTLPANAPFDPSKKYSISWTIRNTTDKLNQTEYFNVDSQSDFLYEEVDTVVLEGQEFSDTLAVPSNSTVTAFTVRILLEDGSAIYTDESINPTATSYGDKKLYTFDFPQLAGLNVQYTPYVIEWKYTVNGRAQREYHFLYVANTKLIILMEQLRQLIDKARFNHPNINLRYTDVDLMAYLIQGATIVNGTRPSLTSYMPTTFPRELEFFLINAAAYVALSAQYLAEGTAAFDFSGQSVSLTVDRTQYIDSALSRIIDILQNQLPIVKKNIALSSGAGVLGLSLGPTLNPRFANIMDSSLAYGYSGRGGAIVQRSTYYNTIIRNITESEPANVVIEATEYTFTQSTPSLVWVLDHNLGRRPDVSISTLDGTEIFGDIQHLSNNQLSISFNAVQSGTARCT